ncbi:MAG TPA: ABC transporter permease [Terriglobia bacterium]|nr:ABC transporter permease [Terriglobia bacterium]
MWERIQCMLVKEFIEVFRDPRMRALIFVVPILQLFIFGYAASTDVRNVATAVYDLDNTVSSRELVSRFTKSGYFNVVAYISNDARERELLDQGKVQVVLHLDHGFEDDLRGGRSAPFQLIVDGTDSNTAGIVLGYSNTIVQRFSQEILSQRILRLRGNASQPGQVVLKTRTWFNENLESRTYFVPGVIALMITLLTLLLTSLAIVREKEIGTMEQIMVTPIRPVEFILGKTVPFALISFVDLVLVAFVGVFWFEIPVRGSFGLLFFAMAVYLMSALGIGLLISTVSQTQQQAMISTFFFFMPAVLLSGFMFPIANMPVIVQWLTYLNPMRYVMVILRGIFLKGVGLNILWPQITALAVMGVVTLSLASRRFRKTLA